MTWGSTDKNDYLTWEIPVGALIIFILTWVMSDSFVAAICAAALILIIGDAR